MTSAESYVQKRLKPVFTQATLGLKIVAYQKGKKIVQLEEGDVYKNYDIASLTKIVFAVTATMSAFEKKLISEKDLLVKHLPWMKAKDVKIWHLLTHSAGFPWWQPFFQSLVGPDELEQKIDDGIRLKRWNELLKILRPLEAAFSDKSTYSDIDFLLVGAVLESVFEKPLLHIWQNLSEELKLSHTHFHVNNQPMYSRNTYAPTENCNWRKMILQGEVHDENTWALGGVSSHAGLFSTMEDLTKWSLGLRGALRDEKKWIVSHKTAKHFCKRAIDKSFGDWGLGFMLPTIGSASCGKYFSTESVGHTGFTGTSIWYDPKKDLLVIILSHRVHPTRENKNFATLRPQIHNWICESIL